VHTRRSHRLASNGDSGAPTPNVSPPVEGQDQRVARAWRPWPYVAGVGLGIALHTAAIATLQAIGEVEASPSGSTEQLRTWAGAIVAAAALLLAVATWGRRSPGRWTRALLLLTTGATYFALTMLDGHVLDVVTLTSHGVHEFALDSAYHGLGPLIAWLGLRDFTSAGRRSGGA